MHEGNQTVDRYLNDLRTHLRRLPEGEQREIVQEIANHIAEAAAAGRSVEEVLARLGPADRLARAYVAEALLGSGRPSLGQWLRAAAVLAGFSATSLVVVPVLGLLGVFFPIVSVLGAIGNLVQFFFPAVDGIGGTHIPGASPGATLALGLILDAMMFVVGIAAFRGLKTYIRASIRTVRSAWPNAA